MRCILIFLLVFSLSVRAEEWKTTDGTVYEKVKVLSHDDAFVTIMYADGGARVPLRLLRSDLQTRFGYNPAKAGAVEAAAQSKDAAERAALLAKEQQQLQQQQTAVASPAPASGVVPAPIVSLPANNGPPFDGGLMQNGDFSHGDRSWQGDGLTPIAYARFTHRNTVDPALAKGLIVPLSPNSWTRIYQQFQDDPGTMYSIQVTYRIAPGTQLSQNPEDYKDISKRINLTDFDTYSSMNVPVNSFYGTIGDPQARMIAMEVFTPGLKSSDVQTYEHSYPAIPPKGDKTFALAFPPGTGAVALLTVKVMSK